jgi:selenocysteine lyase/cysteine desulfurase
VPFGSHIKSVHFNSTSSPLSVDAAGPATPIIVSEARHMLERRIQADPMRFQYTRAHAELHRLRARLAPLLGVRDVAALALAASRSAALCAALDSLRSAPGDVFLVIGELDAHTTMRCIDEARILYGVKVVEMPLRFPLSDAQILEQVHVSHARLSA